MHNGCISSYSGWLYQSQELYYLADHAQHRSQANSRSFICPRHGGKRSFVNAARYMYLTRAPSDGRESTLRNTHGQPIRRRTRTTLLATLMLQMKICGVMISVTQTARLSRMRLHCKIRNAEEYSSHFRLYLQSNSVLCRLRRCAATGHGTAKTINNRVPQVADFGRGCRIARHRRCTAMISGRDRALRLPG